MKFVMLMIVVTVLAGCGRSAPPAVEPPAPQPSAQASRVENNQIGFLQAMVPHHEMALEMARMAKSKSKMPEVKNLAEEILRTQQAEIDEMKKIYQRLTGTAFQADSMAHEKLGLSMRDAGMDMDMKMLHNSASFDRHFLEMMIPHHEGAVRMSNEVLTMDGVDPEIAQLAKIIIATQEKEIEMMKQWLEKMNIPSH